MRSWSRCGCAGTSAGRARSSACCHPPARSSSSTLPRTRRDSTARAGSLSIETSPGAILTGLTTRSQIIDTDEQEYVAGVAFRAGGTRPFVDVPAHELSNADVPLEALWGPPSVALLRDQLLAARDPQRVLDVLEAALLDRWREGAVHPAVALALAAFDARPAMSRIGDVTSVIALSPKRFIEHFKSDIGLTPKRYCRLRRFQRAVAGAHAGRTIDWTELALLCGYFDQAHFIHEFRDFAGMSPTAYEALRTSFPNHVTFLQSSVG